MKTRKLRNKNKTPQLLAGGCFIAPMHTRILKLYSSNDFTIIMSCQESHFTDAISFSGLRRR